MDWSRVDLRDEHVEALHSYLSGDTEAWKALNDRITCDEIAASYMSLIYGAFVAAVRRKFSSSYSLVEVVRYVADLRIRIGADGGGINGRVAENLIRDVVGDPDLRKDPDFQDPYSVVPAELAILADLVFEASYDDAGLREFVRDSTRLARGWVAARQAESRSE